VVVPGLSYGPDEGFQPFRENIQRWTGRFFGSGGAEKAVQDEHEKVGDRICVTGGASQNLACVLQVYSDPVYTKVWMVAPCYFLACRIFEDSGGEFIFFLEGSLRG
jgi:DNA-binding transcriptional MocR family regulator